MSKTITIIKVVLLAIVASLFGIYGWILLALGLYYGNKRANVKTWILAVLGIEFIEVMLGFLLNVAFAGIPAVSLVSELGTSGLEIFGVAVVILFLILFGFSVLFTYAAVRTGRRRF